MRLIKRYPNRKLYDTSARQYVTLHEIAQMISRDETVQVLDTRTGLDVTKISLSKIVLEKEKTEGILPSTFLTDLLKRSGRQIMGYIKRTIHLGNNAAQWLEEEVDRSIKGLVRVGKLAVGDGDGLKLDLVGKIRDRLVHEQAALDKRFRDALERGLSAINVPTKGEVDRLSHRLDEINARVERLLGKPRARRQTRGARLAVKVHRRG
jgi:polyhydroxyalkanoate synthesis repressor PhaR